MAYQITKVKDLQPVTQDMISQDDLFVIYENDGETTNSVSVAQLQAALLEGKNVGLGTVTSHKVEEQTDAQYGNLIITQNPTVSDEVVIDKAIDQMTKIKLKVNNDSKASQITTIKGVQYNDGVIEVEPSGITTIQKDEEDPITVDKLIFTGDGVTITTQGHQINIPGIKVGNQIINSLVSGNGVSFEIPENNPTQLTIKSESKDITEVDKTFKVKTYTVIPVTITENGKDKTNYQRPATENPNNPSFERGEIFSVYFNDRDKQKNNIPIKNLRNSATLFTKQMTGLENETPIDYITNYGIFITDVDSDGNQVFRLIASDRYLFEGRLQSITKEANTPYTKLQLYGSQTYSVLDSLPNEAVTETDIFQEGKTIIKDSLISDGIPRLNEQGQIKDKYLPPGLGTIVVNGSNVETESTVIPVSGDQETLIFSAYEGAGGTAGTGGSKIVQYTCRVAPQPVEGKTNQYYITINDVKLSSLINSSLILLKSDQAWTTAGSVEIRFTGDNGKGNIYCNNASWVPAYAVQAGDNILMLYSQENNENKFYILANDDLVGKSITLSENGSNANYITLRYEGRNYYIPTSQDQVATRTLEAGTGISITPNSEGSIINIGLTQPNSSYSEAEKRNLYLNGTGNWSQISTDTLPFENGVLLSSALPLDVLIPIIHPVGSCYETDDPDFAPNNLDWSSANNYFLTTAERDAGIRWELIDQKNYMLQSPSGGEAPIVIYKWFKRPYMA